MSAGIFSALTDSSHRNDGLALTQAYLRDMSCRFEQENARIQTEKRRKAEHTQMPPRRASVVHV